MAVTKDQATEQNGFWWTHTEFHYGECYQDAPGPRGGIGRIHQTRVRRMGATKVWRTRPQHFRIPTKFGLYARSSAAMGLSEIDHTNCHLFHTAADCPLARRANGDQDGNGSPEAR